MNKLLITLLLGIFIISLVSASQTYQVGTEVDLKVTCLNGGYCSNISYCNINVANPNDSLLVTGQNMTNQISFHNYTINPDSLGIYCVTGFCDDSGETQEIDFTFYVTPNGETLSTGGGIIYSLFSLFLFFIVCVISFFIVAMPSENEKDDKGFATKVIRLKYFRPILIIALYLSLVLLLNFLNGLASAFSTLSMFSGVLGFLFETMMRLSWPFTIIVIAWIVIMLIKDTNINRQLDKFDKFDPFNG